MKTVIRCKDCGKDITDKVKYYCKGVLRCEPCDQKDALSTTEKK